MKGIYKILYEIICERLNDRYDNGTLKDYWVGFNSNEKIKPEEWIGDPRPRMNFESKSIHVRRPDHYTMGLIEKFIKNRRETVVFPRMKFERKCIIYRDEFVDKCIEVLEKLLISVVKESRELNKQYFEDYPIINFVWDDTELEGEDGKYPYHCLLHTQYVPLLNPSDLLPNIILEFNPLPFDCSYEVFYEPK